MRSRLVEFLIVGVGESLIKLDKSPVRVNNFIGLIHKRLESEFRPSKISIVITVCKENVEAEKKMLRDMRIMTALIYIFFRELE